MKGALTREIFHVPVYAWGVGLLAFGGAIFLFLRSRKSTNVGSPLSGIEPVFPFATSSGSPSTPPASPVSQGNPLPNPPDTHNALMPNTDPIVTHSQEATPDMHPVVRAIPGKQPTGYNPASDTYSPGKLATTTYSKKVPQQYRPKPRTFTKPQEQARKQQAQNAGVKQVVTAGGPIHL